MWSRLITKEQYSEVSSCMKNADYHKSQSTVTYTEKNKGILVLTHRLADLAKIKHLLLERSKEIISKCQIPSRMVMFKKTVVLLSTS